MVDSRDTIRVSSGPMEFEFGVREKPGRVRRFFQAVKRNLFPPEPMPSASRAGGLHGTVVLPRHQVTMLRRAAGELLSWQIHEADSFFQSVTTPGGHVPDPEDRITLAEMDEEIRQAQHAIQEFDKVFHA